MSDLDDVDDRASEPTAEPVSDRRGLAAVLFVATLVSTFYVGATQATTRTPDEVFFLHRAEGTWPALRAALSTLAHGWVFAVPLMAILLCHEFGHYLTARHHRVPVTLPMFIPFPNLFGTMGAVISMKGRIATRNALLDVGASGPLAGLAVAIPVTALGLSLSTIEPVTGHEHVLIEGDSLLYLALKRIVCGAIPPGHDVWLHPVAFAGWAGFFVTMMNLLPIGQLDGGHVAYALLGPRQDKVSRWMIRGLLLLAVAIAVRLGMTVPRALWSSDVFTPAVIWGLWAALGRGLLRLSGDRHPPTDDETLSPVRRVVAVVTLACFALLFMPLPIQLK